MKRQIGNLVLRGSLIFFELENVTYDLVCTSGILIDRPSEAKIALCVLLLIQCTFGNKSAACGVGCVVVVFLVH